MRRVLDSRHARLNPPSSGVEGRLRRGMRSRSRPRWLGWISKAWRTPATGLSFATFGLWSVWLSLCWLPLRALFGASTAEPWRLAQRAIHRMYRLHVKLMERVGVIEVHWIG